jgi:hypothetical protein
MYTSKAIQQHLVVGKKKMEIDSSGGEWRRQAAAFDGSNG